MLAVAVLQTAVQRSFLMYADPSKLRPTFSFASVLGARSTFEQAFASLTAEEQARANRFFQRDDRERFALGRSLLRSVLENRYSIRESEAVFEADGHGKLHLRSRPEIAFSISHSGDVVMVGVGRGVEVGVDVERHREDVDLARIGNQVFAPCEQVAILKSPPLEHVKHFYRQWTMKEALLKAVGTGFALDPRRFAIDPTVKPPSIAFLGDGPDDVGEGWIVEDINVRDGYSASMAWRPKS